MHATLAIHEKQGEPALARELHGHFAEHLGRCVYEGLWVGTDSNIGHMRGIRNDVVSALKALSIPVLRWPGGCFADEYHWRDGVGQRHRRPKTLNTHWGGVVETHQFGTHEFMDLCEQLGTEPYICGNLGSGSVQEMSEWVEYLTSNAATSLADLRRSHDRQEPWSVKYFGVGNESWGCGGNLRPEAYADLYRRYATFLKNYAGNRLYKIACGANGADYEWTRILMSRAGRHMDGLSLHHYTLPTGNWSKKGSATEFDEAGWHETLRRALVMDELIAKHSAIMDRYDPERRVGLIVDEWGTWYDAEPGTNPAFLYQQNTLRDALVAALTLHVFHAHAERVKMANLAQTVNVLQALILTHNNQFLLTPTYHAFALLRPHQGATRLCVEVDAPDYVLAEQAIPRVSASASVDATGKLHLSVVNTGATDALQLQARLPGENWQLTSAHVLTHPEANAHNSFEEPTRVRPQTLTGVRCQTGLLEALLPPKSVSAFSLQPLEAAGVALA